MRTTGGNGPGSPLISRRQLTAAIPALMLAPKLLAEPSGLKLSKLNCFEIRVSDVPASVRFYQGLFGMAVQARDDDRVCLRVGDGPQFMAVRGLTAGETPAITQIGYSVEDYDTDRALAALGRIGFGRIDAPPVSDPGIDHAMKTWIRERGATRELYFSDARGLIVQLSAVDYCGGTGEKGNACARAEPAPAGLMKLSDISHFTAFVSNGNEANQFYQETFGLKVQAYQGQGSPVTGIGDGRQFVMYAGGFGRGGAAPTPASLNHGCFNMYDFDVDKVLATLTKYGLSARGDARTAGPMMHYVSLRMPNRGGAEGGTPELYFTDPDGILMQLQDLTYCGGGGYLGNECLTA
jgi:catechol 2,3-dioxygenase-like lactoylglutathione lyase family enzyme